MASWSRQRRFIYGGGTMFVIVGLGLFFGWKLFYQAPTCFDGVKNGAEQGVDCGGSCVKLCPSTFLSPVANWTRFEEVAPGLYNVAAYIVNPNGDGEAFAVPYHMELYDAKAILITEYDSVVNIPANRNTLAFSGAVPVGERIPSKAVFRFTGTPDWSKQQDRLKSLAVVNKEYGEDDEGSYLVVTLKNTSVEAIGRFSVYVVLYDGNNNVVSFSKTIIDGADAGATVLAPFTWPVNRQGRAISIEVLPVSE